MSTARGVVHDARLEHQLVVGLGLDQDDVDARVALLPAPRQLVQPLVGEQLERLVADLREAHVRHATRRVSRRASGSACSKSLTYGHQRVDDDDELGARLDRDVEVGGGDDPAVDQLAVLDLDRLVDHRQRARGADRLRDRYVVPTLGAEHDPLAGVEVGGGEVQLVLRAAGSRRCGPGRTGSSARSARSPRPCTGRTAAPRRGRARGRPPRPAEVADQRAAPACASRQREHDALRDELACSWAAAAS